MKTAKRLEKFPEYIFSRLGRKKKEIEKKTGRRVLDLSIGTPDYPPSKKYIKKLKDEVSDPKTYLYPGFGANPEFEKALIHWYKERFKVELLPSELLPLLGGKDGVAHLPLALIDKGDEALVPDPGYPGFSGPLMMFEGKVINYTLNEKNGFKPDILELEKKITNKTRYFWINFPSNPTGQVADLSELKEYVKFADRHKIVLIYDNAYAEIAYDGFIAPSILQIPGAKNVAVELGSFSKSHSFAGLRMGWVAGNSQIVGALAKVKSQLDSGMSAMLQNLGAYALTHEDLTWKKNMLSDYLRRRDIVAGKLQMLGLEFELPRGGLYIWAKIPKNEKDSEEYCLKLLEEKQILLAPGTAFGKNGKKYVRVCFSSNIDGIDKYF
jgi:LL-diaminopimelate aminotransferase